MFKGKRKRVSAEGDWGRCSICETPLVLIPWNTKVDIPACDNIDCDKYRNPAGAIANHGGESDGE